MCLMTYVYMYTFTASMPVSLSISTHLYLHLTFTYICIKKYVSVYVYRYLQLCLHLYLYTLSCTLFVNFLFGRSKRPQLLALLREAGQGLRVSASQRHNAAIAAVSVAVSLVF